MRSPAFSRGAARLALAAADVEVAMGAHGATASAEAADVQEAIDVAVIANALRALRGGHPRPQPERKELAQEDEQCLSLLEDSAAEERPRRKALLA